MTLRPPACLHEYIAVVLCSPTYVSMRGIVVGRTELGSPPTSGVSVQYVDMLRRCW